MRTRYWLSCLLLLCFFTAKSQQEEDIDTTYKPLIKLPKTYLLDNIDLIANMRFAGQNRFVNNTYTGSSFVNEQFRLEIKGQITDKLYFRFRDRYTRDPITQSVDNLSRSTDYAFLRFDPSEHWKIYAGKLSADWGGYEFDANPIDIYEFSDIIEFADNFLSGAGLAYLPNRNHEFTFQLLNSRTRTFQEIYDTIPGITESKFPFAAVSNWRGKFWGGKFQTIWSYSLFKEATHQYMNYFAFGNQLQLHRVRVAYDFKLSLENLDRKMIVSGITDHGPAKQGVRYMSHWISADVQISRIVHLVFQGMLDFAYWDGNPDPTANKKLRTAWGYIPAVEVYPLKKVNVKIFANMVGRVYRYTDYAKLAFGQSNNNNFRFSVGFITPLTVL